MLPQDFIKQYVTCSLVPYWNENKELAIGYNNTINVTSATIWLKEQAEADLDQRIRQTTMLLRAKLSIGHTLTFNQTTALVSLFLDIGYENIRKTKFIDYLEDKNWVMATSSFMLFNKNRLNTVSVKKTARRKAEQVLFNTED